MFEVSFRTGSAREEVITPKGNKVVHNYVLFVDQKGAHVLARKGAIYMTKDNAVVVD